MFAQILFHKLTWECLCVCLCAKVPGLFPYYTCNHSFSSCLCGCSNFFFPLHWAYCIWNQSELFHFIPVAVAATCYPHSVFLTCFIILLKFHCSNSLRKPCGPQIGTHEYIIYLEIIYVSNASIYIESMLQKCMKLLRMALA